MNSGKKRVELELESFELVIGERRTVVLELRANGARVFDMASDVALEATDCELVRVTSSLRQEMARLLRHAAEHCEPPALERVS